MVSAAPPKDPAKVRAGRIGATVRWGDTPRVIRLDSLPPDQRRAIVAYLAVAQSVEKAAPDVETGAATAGGTRDAAPTD